MLHSQAPFKNADNFNKYIDIIPPLLDTLCPVCLLLVLLTAWTRKRGKSVVFRSLFPYKFIMPLQSDAIFGLQLLQGNVYRA